MLVLLASLGFACDHAGESLRAVRPPATRDVLVAFEDGWIPVGSLVRVVGECPEGTAVEVVSLDWRYRQAGRPSVDHGEVGCVDDAILAPVSTLVSLGPPPDADATAPAGEPVDVCATLSELKWARPALAVDDRVRAALVDASADPGWVMATDWGRVALPLTLYDQATIEAEWAREGLDTEERREKAVVGTGPVVDGVPLYLHFLGTDERFSDAWGTSATIAGLVRLAHGWSRHCRDILGRPAAHCVLQIGDIGWYNGKLPDPLGHADHYTGQCTDLRLFRDDGSRYEAWWNEPDDRPGVTGGYDRPLNLAFLRYVADHAPVWKLYFNDPQVRADEPRVQFWRGHDDHVHLCLK